MFGLSAGELMVVAIVVAIIFGWTWIPRIGQGIGEFVSGVKKGSREDDERIVVRQVQKRGKEDGK
jgi:Sec-independent protein translocase protein TatA